MDRHRGSASAVTSQFGCSCTRQRGTCGCSAHCGNVWGRARPSPSRPPAGGDPRASELARDAALSHIRSNNRKRNKFPWTPRARARRRLRRKRPSPRGYGWRSRGNAMGTSQRYPLRRERTPRHEQMRVDPPNTADAGEERRGRPAFHSRGQPPEVPCKRRCGGNGAQNSIWPCGRLGARGENSTSASPPRAPRARLQRRRGQGSRGEAARVHVRARAG